MIEVVKTVAAWVGLVIVVVGFGGMTVIIIWEVWLRPMAKRKLDKVRDEWKRRQYSE